MAAAWMLRVNRPRGAAVILIVAAFVSMMDRSVIPPVMPVVAADMGASRRGRSLAHRLCSHLRGVSVGLEHGGFQSRAGPRSRHVGRRWAVGQPCDGPRPGRSRVRRRPRPGGRGVRGDLHGRTGLQRGDDDVSSERWRPPTSRPRSAGTRGGHRRRGAVAEWWEWRWVFVVVAVFSLVLTASWLRLSESTSDTKERVVPSLQRLAGNRWAIAILVLTIVEGVLLIGVFNYFAVALQTTGATVLVAGLATAAFGASVVIVSQLMRLVLGRWPAWVLMLVAGLAIMGAYIAVAVQVSLGTVVAAAILLGVAWASATRRCRHG